jgi:pimeloyl-ACP methyl ester carboxylesterase
LTGVLAPVLYQQRGLPPTTIAEPFTVEANVADAEAVIDQAAGGRAWIVGHSWGGYLALHVLVSCPERIAGAIVVDPLGAQAQVLGEFEERMLAPMTEAQRARVAEIEAKEAAGTATTQESKESLSLYWPSYFADPANAPPVPDLELSSAGFVATMESVKQHEEAETLVRGLPGVAAEIPVLFVHGAESAMPVRASTGSAELLSNAAVDIIPGAGHFIWSERPAELRDAISAFVRRAGRR